MLNILVNGSPFSIDSRSVRTMGELVEYVKSNIDPDTIITSMSISGRALNDVDWRVPLVAQGGATLEFATGTKTNYLLERLALVDPFLESIGFQFILARECLERQELRDGNKAFAGAVKNLKAFIDWYGTLLELFPVEYITERNALVQQILNLQTTCNSLLQLQMRQQWTMVALTLENKLEPQLADLRKRCAEFRHQ